MENLFNEIYDDNEQILDETIEFLSEASVNSKKIVGSKERKKILLAQCELICAKENNDPLYAKYKKARKIAKKCRLLIHAKYSSKAKVKAKEYLKKKKERSIKKK